MKWSVLSIWSLFISTLWTKTFIYIFFFSRTPDEPSRDAKSCPEVNHHSSTSKSISNHASVKPSVQEASASNSMLSSFLYGMPMSSQPHPDSKLDLKPTSLHSIGKERLGMWASADEKAVQAKECADNGKSLLLSFCIHWPPLSFSGNERCTYDACYHLCRYWTIWICFFLCAWLWAYCSKCVCLFQASE